MILDKKYIIFKECYCKGDVDNHMEIMRKCGASIIDGFWQPGTNEGFVTYKDSKTFLQKFQMTISFEKSNL